MNIIISNSSAVPLYEQIQNQIKTQILNGEVKADEHLPSIRSLAKELKVSIITKKIKSYTITNTSYNSKNEVESTTTLCYTFK